jgi:hypothetical protein
MSPLIGWPPDTCWNTGESGRDVARQRLSVKPLHTGVPNTPPKPTHVHTGLDRIRRQLGRDRLTVPAGPAGGRDKRAAPDPAAS